MKLNQFIREATDNIADINLLKKYFDIGGNITSGSNGLEIDGDIDVKDRIKLEELPVKIHQVTGDIRLQVCGLISLKNFPSSANKVDVSGNSELLSLETDQPIICRSFDATGTGITSLDNVKITANTLHLRDCNALQKVLGSSVQIKNIDVSECINLKDDPSAIPGIEVVRINPYVAKDVPLVSMILLDRVKIIFEADEFTPASKELEKIIKDYRNKGPKEVLNLIRALRDAGYKGNAKL